MTVDTRDLADLKREVALGCRVMAHRGLVEDILGHISVRVDEDHALVRCRGPRERGLRFTTPHDVGLVELSSGAVVDDPTGSLAPPNELPIHTAVLRSRPDARCVVHAHPPSVVVASLAEFPLEPIYGAYDIPGTRMAADGIPVHPRAALIRTDDLAAEMVASLGSAPVLVLAGHGAVSLGSTVAGAVLRCLALDRLASIHLRVRQAGMPPSRLSDEDLAELPDLGTGFNEATLWRHHLAALEADGGGLDRSD